MKIAFDDFIAIVAPFPRQGTVVEGWQSRIRAVDHIFAGQRRIYLNFDESLAPQSEIVAVRHADNVVEYRLSPLGSSHREFVRQAIAAARFVYVHTVHWARYVLLFYPSGKLVTDFHGIVPEEEAMLGRPETGAFYEVVERFVLMNSPIVVVVSNAMREHLLKKYPACSAEFIVMPIIEKYSVGLENRIDRPDSEKPHVIYSGAAQVWQNIDLMLDVCRRARPYFDYLFVSHDHQLIKNKAAALGIADAIAFDVKKKEEMPTVYLAADYGFVLREDVAVNRVACPTKLSEYMQFGVIPVVKLVEIGDLGEEGYAYITHEEFAAGVVPERSIANGMRRHNKAIIDRLAQGFEGAAQRLQILATSAPHSQSRFAGLFEGGRYLIFPSHADFYAFSDPLRYGRAEVVDGYRTIEIAVSGALPARLFRFVPILADCRLTIKRLVIEHDAGDGAASVKSIHINGDAVDGSWVLSRENPHIDIETTGEIRVVRFRAEVDFLHVGPGIDVPSADRAREPQIPGVDAELVQGQTVHRSRVTPTMVH